MSALLTNLTKTNLGRTISHAVLAFVAAVVPLLVYTSWADLKVALIAALPAGATALFRILAPNYPTVDPAPAPTPPAPPAPAAPVSEAAQPADNPPPPAS